MTSLSPSFLAGAKHLGWRPGQASAQPTRRAPVGGLDANAASWTIGAEVDGLPPAPNCIANKAARSLVLPGLCKGKAHRPENLGYAGRRVLVSCKWSGKTLADHRADRKAWLLAMLGLATVDDQRYRWERVSPPDHMPPTRRLLHIITDRARWQAALDEARRRAQDGTGELSAIGTAA